MIEIIGVEKREESEKEWRCLPKNVRQIGECRDRWKIYIEDYVVTYLNKMARPDQAYARGAILFGKIYDTEEGQALFISGAVEAGNLELDMDETVFNEAIWYELIEKGEKYFPGQEVMGWFLSRMGFSVEMNQKIMNTHMNNFAGDYKILYMIDSLEKEDAVYLCENRQMKRQKGYYIYYEKNSAMQDYMLENEKGKKESCEEQTSKTEIRRDKKIVNSYRRMSRYSKDNKKQDVRIRAIRAACAVLIFVMGIYIAGKLGNRFVNVGFDEYAVAAFQAVRSVFLQESPDMAEENIQQGEAGNPAKSDSSSDGSDVTGVMSPDVTGVMSSDVEGLAENSGDEQVQSQTGNSGDEQVQSQSGNDGDSGLSEETQETWSYPKPLYYVVKKGDTLAAISRKMYSTDKYTSRLAQANNLSNADEIYEGQKILIPSIE